MYLSAKVSITLELLSYMVQNTQDYGVSGLYPSFSILNRTCF